MTLSEHLLARRAEIAAHAIDAMYEDPFWIERYGERGRKFSLEDGAYHVTYLVEALRGDGAIVMERYARWLQTVLTSRGMCSAHLGESFGRIGVAIDAVGIEHAAPALVILEAAARALTYDAGPARDLQLGAKTIAAAASAALGGCVWPTEPELVTLVHYLADAVHLGRPDLFAGHARFLAEFVERRGVARARVAEVARALGDAARFAGAATESSVAAAIAAVRMEAA